MFAYIEPTTVLKTMMRQQQCSISVQISSVAPVFAFVGCQFLGNATKCVLCESVLNCEQWIVGFIRGTGEVIWFGHSHHSCAVRNSVFLQGRCLPASRSAGALAADHMMMKKDNIGGPRPSESHDQ